MIADQSEVKTNGMAVLEVNPRVSLLTLATVKALRGCTTDAVKRDVESGKLLWVFDFSISKNAPDTRSAALRVWFIELLQRPGVKQLSLENVIEQILPPTRARYTAADFCVKFSTNKITLMDLRRQFKWAVGFVTRDQLVGFLQERWIGGIGQ
ncbi:MAG TPA: hypothetical protein VGN23_13130 [Verrucomicrobiae bacterium]|jgi:hypothetical protein